jgi:hypothetical protein
MSSARHASLLIGAVFFVVISAGFTFIYYSLNLNYVHPLRLAIGTLVVAILMASLVSLSVRLGIFAARRNSIPLGSALAIAGVYATVWILLGLTRDRLLDVVVPANQTEAMGLVLLEAIVGVTFLPAVITYLISLATKDRARGA